MSRPWVGVALLGLGLPTASRQAPSPAVWREFRIDAAHSTVGFQIPFMYSHVDGRFDDVRGTVLLPDSTTGQAAGAAMAVIQVASLNTGSAHRDEHLKSSDFFDADRYPTIVFRSSTVSGTWPQFTLQGRLSMHGVTRVVRIPCRVTLPPTHDPHHAILAIVAGALTVARNDFDILGGSEHNEWFDKLRSATMGDSVRITLEIHLWRPDPKDPATGTVAMLARVDSLGIDSAVARLRAAFTRDSVGFTSAQPSLDDVGEALLERNRLREGFLWLHAVARLLPASAEAMVSVGTANAMMGDTTRAGIWYREAWAADSLDTRVYVRAIELGISSPLAAAP